MDQINPVPQAGMLLVYKEKNWTSFDVTAKLRRLLHTKRVGHTGTLDPEAEGVLVVVYGKATRLAELFSGHDKTYEAVVRLGVVTDTQDMTGRILSGSTSPDPALLPDEEQIRRAAASFEGDQMQIPPMYSALKVGGKKLYELARQGVSVERRARQVHFDRILVKKTELPFVTLEVSCSKGTYIRTLCHDLGRKLGCGAAMESLVRTRSGAYDLSMCSRIGELESLSETGHLAEKILTVEEILKDYPDIRLSADLDRLLLNGNPLSLHVMRTSAPPFAFDENRYRVRMYTSTGCLAGLYTYRPDEQRFVPLKMLI